MRKGNYDRRYERRGEGGFVAFVREFMPNRNVLILVLLVVFLFLIFKGGFTGNVLLEISNEYYVGDNLSGELSLVMEKDEFIPANAEIVVNNGGRVNVFLLSDLVSRDVSVGDYNIEGFDVNGSGEGYGVVNVSYPEVGFVLSVERMVESVSESGDVGEVDNVTEVVGEVNETAGENVTEVIKEKVVENETIVESVVEEKVVENETIVESVVDVEEEVVDVEEEVESEEVSVVEDVVVEVPVVEEVESVSPLTGQVVLEEEMEVVDITGVVKFGEEFVYELEEGESASLKSSEVPVDFKMVSGRVIITTNYTDLEGDELKVDLAKMNLIAREGDLKMALVYEDLEIVSATNEVSIKVPEVSLDLMVNDTVVSNITEVTKKYKVVVGRPVKWVTVVNTTRTENVSVEIPKDATNVSIKLGEEIDEALRDIEESEIEVDSVVREQVRQVESGITGMVSLNVNDDGGVLRSGRFRLFEATGRVIDGAEVEEKIEETATEKTVVLDDVLTDSNETEVAVEYYTEAPTSSEAVIDSGKEVTISAPDELNYTEVLAFSVIDETVLVSDKDKIKMVWKASRSDALMYGYINESSSLTEVSVSVDFEIYDDNYDGVVDYVSWVVPHLSSQVYEIIYITKAEHLDSNKELIKDIYEEVKEKDNIYTTIKNGEYIRVTFEKELDKTKDITLYAKVHCNETITINNQVVPCEIYYKKARLDKLRGELG